MKLIFIFTIKNNFWRRSSRLTFSGLNNDQKQIVSTNNEKKKLKKMLNI